MPQVAEEQGLFMTDVQNFLVGTGQGFLFANFVKAVLGDVVDSQSARNP